MSISKSVGVNIERLRNRRVLLFVDNAFARKDLIEVIRGYGGEVMCTTTPEEALDVAENRGAQAAIIAGDLGSLLQPFVDACVTRQVKIYAAPMARTLIQHMNTSEPDYLPRTGFITRPKDIRFDMFVYVLRGSGGVAMKASVSFDNGIGQVLEWMDRNELEIAVFPLTLPKFMSLHIGEYAATSGKFKTVLTSQSELIHLTPPYDLFDLRQSPGTFSVLSVSEAYSLPKKLMKVEDALSRVERILSIEPAFNMSDHPAWSKKQATIDDYISTKKMKKRGPIEVMENISENISNGLGIKPVRKRTLVLFVHGLGGSGLSTWGSFPEFLSISSGNTIEVASFAFPTSLFRLPFSTKAPKIQELANGLRTSLKYDYGKFDSIAIVAHSLGGLIARRYLVEEVKAAAPLRVDKLVLFAVPNNGAQLAKVGNLISWRHNQLAQLCSNADIIELINDDWHRFDLSTRIKTKYVIGAQDRVVDRFSASAYWGTDVETILDKGHIDIVKPKSKNDLVVQIVDKFLRAE